MNFRRRIARIREAVKIDELLVDYGYNVHLGGGREQQFSCDLHGTGQDNKPSARVYPSSNSFYCFGCDRSRDPIALVRDKEWLDLAGAIAFLERKYDLPFMASDEEAEQQDPVSILNAARTLGEDLERFVPVLEMATGDRSLPMDFLLSYWEAVDKMVYGVRTKSLAETTAQAACLKLHARLLQAMRDGYVGEST